MDTVEVIVINTGILRECLTPGETDGNVLLSGPVAEARGTSVDTGKVVVVVGHGDDLILGTVALGVTNEGCQPVLFGCQSQ